MSTSIRPPMTGGAGADVSGVESAHVGATSEASAPGATSETAAASKADAANAGAAQAAESPTAQWLAKLESGQVTRSQAVEGLVAEAMQTHGGAKLPPSQRSELESMLRSALLEDPVLGRLLGD